MKSKLNITIIAIAIVAATSLVFAGAKAKHDVTVTVSPINEVTVTGGSITLTINTAAAGFEPDAISDSMTCDLNWTTNESNKKITVATGEAITNATLKVQAQNVNGGTAVSQVVLSNTPRDFITGITKTTGSCDLVYEASAIVAQGTSSAFYTITYTITAT